MWNNNDNIDEKSVGVNDAYIEAIKNYIGANIIISWSDYVPVLDKIKRRKGNHEGNTIGDERHNPILNTQIYELEFLNGWVEEFPWIPSLKFCPKKLILMVGILEFWKR